MTYYRKKPVVIEARQYLWEWNGPTNAEALAAWVNENGGDAEPPPCGSAIGWFLVRTLEGEMMAQPGDWIIKGVQGEFYPCKPDIFEQTYEPVVGDGPIVEVRT